MWRDRRLLDMLKIDMPIIQAPMAGIMDWELVAAVSEAGGLGSLPWAVLKCQGARGALPCAMLNAEVLRDQVGKIRARTRKPINVNFFCHTPPVPSNAREARWRERLPPPHPRLRTDPAQPGPVNHR